MSSLNAMRSKAFTLLELLVVVSITALIAALVVPVFVSAKESGNRARCRNNLRQLALALQLYRQDHSKVEWGDALNMGLPPSASVLLNFDMSPNVSDHIGTCRGPSRPQEHVQWGFHYYYHGNSPKWKDYVTEEKDQAIILYDVYHNPADVPLHAPHVTHYAIGVSLNGEVVSMKRVGSPFQIEWWKEKN